MARLEGSICYALDYQEPVRIVRVERRGVAPRYCIERLNGAMTSNYPHYLLTRFTRARRQEWNGSTT